MPMRSDPGSGEALEMMDDIALNALRGTTPTVRELLTKWGYRIRNHESVPRIRFDLERVGLTTDPPFATGPMDAPVRIVPIAPEKGDTPVPPGGVEAAGRTEDEAVEAGPATDELPQVSMRVGHLPAARGGVVSVKPTDSYEHAVTLMMQWDFSQIPVIEGDSYLRGAVTWRSVARMYAFGHAPSLANATEQEVQIVHTHDDLLATLPVVTAYDYVLVRNEHGHICGIVTTADLALQFENVARPFFTIGEIERRLRQCLAPVFDGDPAVQAATRGQADRVDGMMFGNYLTLLRQPQCWRRLGWPVVDQGLFVTLLNDVREIRNEVMHFRPTALTAGQYEQLDQFLGMLKNINP
jgi:CBS domain-containing protein